MNRFNEILNEMKPLMGSLVPEERDKLLQLEEELKILQFALDDIKNKIGSIKVSY